MGEGSTSHGLQRLRRPFWRSKARGRSPSPEKCDNFLRKKVNSFRITPPGPVQFHDQEQKFRPKEEDAAEDLIMIIKAHDGDPKTNVKIEDTPWSSVFEQMTVAKERSEKKTGMSSKAVDGADLMSAYINLVPDDFGIGILKGGLALILDAAKAYEENRERIIQTFETLPESILTINTAFQFLDPEPEDLKIQTNFLRMLLRDIPVLINILLGNEPWYRKVFEFLLLRIPETSTIDEILSQWDRQLARLKEHIERMKILLQDKWQSKMSEKLDSTGDKISDKIESTSVGIRELVADGFRDMKRDNAEVLTQVSRSTSTYADLATVFRDYMVAHQRDKEKERRDREYEREIFCRERDELERKNQNLNVQVAKLRRRSLEDRRQASAIKPIHLAGVLEIPAGSSKHLERPEEDHKVVLEESGHLDADDRGKAQWLIQTDEFHDWFRARHTSLLLVDGCMGDLLVSPLSGICAGLIGNLVEAENIATAFYFAGLHAEKQRSGKNGSDPTTGPVAMMRSLISQLLHSNNLPDPDLGFMTYATLKDCHEGNCEVLCNVFAKIVKQVPPHVTVFCVVDGVSWFEQGSWLNDLVYIASMFEYLAGRDNVGRSGPLKALFTSPTQSQDIARLAMAHSDIWGHVSLAAGQLHPGFGSMDSALLY
ncbi:hypothetical protein CkaCkLH20_08406 [Colletotrichum karsti]|uniref:Nephrocystin 3-like N-terminal domain-containing protein n=1 Tax=Colletotrichum karsti TaxID=1095194 RepID=A0A9P6LFD5_9PEZI|nr:uncharacterized protein CkaCkLH20_08406 [Colletotrichum karsti]KAF9874034.1 hypothetical protein CkaCkLH20_08406 [Colletotrichum karsti]